MSELKKVDYSCLVGSQVLMEFWDTNDKEGSYSVGFLVGVEKAPFGVMYRLKNRERFYVNARIYQHPDYWISGMVLYEFNLPDGVTAKAILNDGRGVECVVIGRRFVCGEHSYPIGKVNAVQVTGLAEGYSL